MEHPQDTCVALQKKVKQIKGSITLLYSRYFWLHCSNQDIICYTSTHLHAAHACQRSPPHCVRAWLLPLSPDDRRTVDILLYLLLAKLNVENIYSCSLTVSKFAVLRSTVVGEESEATSATWELHGPKKGILPFGERLRQSKQDESSTRATTTTRFRMPKITFLRRAQIFNWTSTFSSG